MKDEEMAENWIAEYTGVDVETQKAIQLQYHKNLKQAFLAGLKAKTQWHDLRKDKNDLPKEQKEYWCKVYYFESEETFNAFLWFDANTKDFKFLEEIENSVESSFNVKEWCELPAFDKE